MGSTGRLASTFRCIIMGPPGSGKGTIATRIHKDFKLAHLSCGDLLRTHIQQDTYLGREVTKYMKEGQLVPDDLICRVMETELDRYQTPVLLDGYPRTVNQATFLQTHHPINVVLHLKVPFEVIMERVKDRWIHESSGRVYNLRFNPPKSPGLDDITDEPLIQREDDRPEVVQGRFITYSQWEQPLAAFYEQLKIIQDFHGTETNKIWPKVYDFLATKLTSVQKSVYH